MSEAAAWFLEHVDDAGLVVRVPIVHVPFRIGRGPGVDLELVSAEVSTEHAEIVSDGTQLLVRDLGSTNGTYLHNQPVGSGAPLAPGDIFLLGPYAFRLGFTGEQQVAAEVVASPASAAPAVAAPIAAAPIHTSPPAFHTTPAERPDFAEGDVSAAFGALLERGAVEPVFQPIVDLRSGETVALEALGRGKSPRLPQNPVELFRIAEASGEARELARCFRQTALAAAHWARIRLPIFVNVHATELAAHDFFDEIAAIRERHPKIRLVLEVSEQFSTPLPRLRALRSFLNQHGIALSYDDFGAGLARIQELAEAPADYLKFDAKPIQGLNRPDDPEKRRVSALVGAAKALGMRLLAKGIESVPEAEACVQMGFELGQGYLFGHPAPVTAAGKR